MLARPRRLSPPSHAFNTLLFPDIWEAIIESAWNAALAGDGSLYDALPAAVALASACSATRDALQPFLLRARLWLIELRERAAHLSSNLQLPAAEPLLELYLFGCRVLFGARSPRTVAALDSLARLKGEMGRAAEAEALAYEALAACAALAAAPPHEQEREEARAMWPCWRDARDDGLFEWQPARSIAPCARSAALLQLSAAHTLHAALRRQAKPEEARLAAELRDATLGRLLGASSRHAPPSPPPAAAGEKRPPPLGARPPLAPSAATRRAALFVESCWLTVDALLAAGLSTAAELLALEVDAVGRQCLGAAHASCLHISHLAVQALREAGRYAEAAPRALEAEALWRARLDALYARVGGWREEGERREAAAQLFICTTSALALLAPATSHEALQCKVKVASRLTTWIHRGARLSPAQLDAPAASAAAAMAAAARRALDAAGGFRLTDIASPPASSDADSELDDDVVSLGQHAALAWQTLCVA
ncbi:hypothetical protein AB1Y20_004894 [Prymnesium parvum]|uniref:KIF-binding protein n=1 Tax=Prymnesium parvum TaxID=97485 RepID=A0AB34IYR2_PRYPA